MNILTTFRQKKDTQGFTLIELMIAIAIIGVLAAVAVPQFTSYLARARVSEAVNYAQGCKTGFIEFYSTQGTFPTTVADSGCTTITTPNISAVSVAGAAAPRIVVSLVNAAPLPAVIRNHHIVLQPLAPGGATVATQGANIVSWRCSITTAVTGNNAAAAAVLDLVPTACRQAPL